MTTTKLWRLADPTDNRFARGSRRGTWSESSGLCPRCLRSSQERKPPLILEWEPGSTEIAEFLWPGLGDDVAAQETVAAELAASFSGVELGPVQMVEPEAPAPGPRVRLPYQGPPLVELWFPSRIPIDRERSSVSFERCEACGHETTTLVGHERRESRFDRQTGTLKTRVVPRTPGQGICVREALLGGLSVLRTHEFPAWPLCTDPVKDLVESSGYRNITFYEVGEVE